MSHQQEITCFLGSGTTPAANQEADQLERRAKTGRANKNRRSGHDSPSDPKDPPKRTMLKRKRVTKEVKKRERKRVNKPRKCKTSRENSSTPTQTNITPMPSPEPNNVFNSGVRDSFDSSATINDRSLTDMLASGTFSAQRLRIQMMCSHPTVMLVWNPKSPLQPLHWNTKYPKNKVWKTQ